VILLGLAFFIALAGLAYYSSSQPNYLQNQQIGAETKQNSPHEAPHSFRGFINFLFPDAISIFTFWLAVAKIVLGTIAYVQIGLLRRAEAISAQSANAAKQSADVAETALLIANRAWVTVEIQVGGPIVFDVNGASITLKYILKNVGHSPATNVWVSPRIIYPVPSTTEMGRFDHRSEMQKDIANLKTRPPTPLGFALFPGDIIVQPITVSISQKDITRATKDIKAIYPVVVGAVDYRMGINNKAHQTGFIVEIKRNDAPRPATTAKNRSAAAIWVDEGDVPAEEIRLFRSFIEGGFAD